MRRGGMRLRLLVIALGVALFVGACRTPTEPAGTASTSTPSATVDPTPTVPAADPLVTIEVCGLAAAATDTTISIFNEQMAAFELAAARNDQAAMELAAKAINDQFVDLAETVTELAERAIDPALRVVLTDIATALEQMTALSYTGTTVDQRKKLVDFTLAIDGVCAPAIATASASPSQG